MAESTFWPGSDCEENHEYMSHTYGGWYPSWSRARTTTRRCVGLGTRTKTFELSTLPYPRREVEYLCEHPASMNHAVITWEKSMKGGLKYGIICISVGLERARYIVDNLRNSLNLCENEGCNVPEDLWISIRKYNVRWLPPLYLDIYIYIPWWWGGWRKMKWNVFKELPKIM